MNFGKLGVWCSTHTFSRAQLLDLAQRTERLGYSVLWYPEGRGYESFALGSFLLERTDTLILATGIANIYGRDPTTMKQGQHSLAKLSGGRFLLGLGVSHAPTVETLRGHRYGKPVATMRAYLDGMERAAAVAPQVDQPPPIVLAALGPRMTRLAAERTAGIHPYNITPEHTAWARKIVGPKAWICAEQKVLLVQEPKQARAVARDALGHYMLLPNYRNNWLRLGFREDELANGGSDRFLDAMVAWGDVAAVKRRIQAHLDAGANHVCIQTLHPAGSRLPDLDALAALAPKA
ncbi:MAG: TIGR03620 family F420-dependent LLM class oxidoreductase [Candidatus Lambdaproteobacteria bacterium]|nr:TIGR03620 family F420-dependent LLM class oxidoreductase [Candidatus Lambdaproteobacteria bacterium]